MVVNSNKATAQVQTVPGGQMMVDEGRMAKDRMEHELASQ